ncbi:hypothetical protein [Paractinoplanes brasiliensis]|uniref:Uncharacterized protein n=1 Tax=Paractinoplanes brasiliensis TaxID=52695 RepID=A0A4V3C7G1_9ACTN|nr:hypothetical protein [Actinoplanes brasiliensis]TDO37518.1 hypothetical protein C8E87_1149 [Actinoplanes brasiliensis]GID33382.1 hypothetical protein Abr02nite_83650 [Actinoplanes brasiliensis]
MRKPELDEEQRAEAGRVSALIEQLGRADDHSDALPAVRAITRDGLVLGDVLGDYLHRVVSGGQAGTISYWPVLELLRAAGADEERAAAKAQWLRGYSTT